MTGFYPPDAFDPESYADVEHARRRFSRLATILARRIEWADDKFGPIPYSLRCDCAHNWIDVPRLHDRQCPLSVLD